uniref:Uncharacterized protein n=1 Tax=Chromera velia CCMP2878 TaxID=1169474 RepID=A0A0G4HR61_9ALVE|eukprot:Cvel_30429.t1-p1 / transcript=Cvel_30429.t1 / gene=Cvel_30429 / organism=Chromera_velia_CCMP2878 / gene_product=hypothetical protein / transcript_product=hypothetical protein / location=Cvel_scaffold4337:5479-5739(-) / protein_length=87 / sequence_SO=supercontig / SO=protein_coding / is_pseudo=false
MFWSLVLPQEPDPFAPGTVLLEDFAYSGAVGGDGFFPPAYDLVFYPEKYVLCLTDAMLKAQSQWGVSFLGPDSVEIPIDQIALFVDA